MRPADVARLTLLSALWGGSFIFIRVAAPALGPIVTVETRVFVAGVTLLLYAMATGQRLELATRWRQYLIIGVVNSAIPFVLISPAELQLTASLASVLNATRPLFGALIAASWIGDPLTSKKIGGIVLGILGVGVLTGWSIVSFSEGMVLSVAASLCGAAFYGLASVYTRARVAGAPALGMAVGSQLGASLVLSPLVPLSMPSGAPTTIVVASVLALALFCTALGYMLYFRLIVDVGPVNALTVTFLTPIFGVAWGWMFLGEAVTAETVLGCVVILAGTALVTGFRPGMPLQLGPRSCIGREKGMAGQPSGKPGDR
jgi:drug/metabolite transporter (DMT)-like permease